MSIVLKFMVRVMRLFSSSRFFGTGGILTLSIIYPQRKKSLTVRPEEWGDQELSDASLALQRPIPTVVSRH